MIAIIDKIGSNINSLVFALRRLKQSYIITCDKKVIQRASHVILPGVGHAERAMQQLTSEGLQESIPSLTQPVLGICLGMQILFESSTESQKTEEVKCLGILEGKIQRFSKIKRLAIPHMGWNKLYFAKTSALSENIKDNNYTYFVHSYFAPVSKYTIATTFYGENFSAIVQYKNFFGMQFHPEKSGKTGEKLLQYFIMQAGTGE